MSDFVYSGGIRFAQGIAADVKVDKDGHPTECCNPFTGECLGGGSNDFSTVKVRFVADNPNTQTLISLPYIDEDNFYAYTETPDYEQTAEYDVVLYKGTAWGFTAYEGTLIGDDNITVNYSIGEGYYILVNGAGTLTFGAGGE